MRSAAPFTARCRRSISPAAAGLAAACAAQAAAEGVLGKESVIEALAQAAIDSDIVKTAATHRHWREVYVGIPYGDGVLEGYIDLLYEDDDGLVVVDYKTDAWRSSCRPRREGRTVQRAVACVRRGGA